MDQLQLILGEITREQPKRDVMGTGMELHGHRFVAQSPRVKVRRVRVHQDGLSGDRGTEGDDAGALFAFIGPTDLTFLSSAVD